MKDTEKRGGNTINIGHSKMRKKNLQTIKKGIYKNIPNKMILE